jgi:hypothetical protein
VGSDERAGRENAGGGDGAGVGVIESDGRVMGVMTPDPVP